MANRLMLAGTGSGCGKTTLTCALLAALNSLGKEIISFKCGPDYIDPVFHKKTSGTESRNLDVFLMGEEGVKYGLAVHTRDKEIAVLEGVMGLYDGLGNGSFASSNHVSVLTNTPVVLIVNTKGLSVSVCALIKGFLDFEKNNIRAVILNNTSEGMYSFYKQMIEERLNIKVIGFMPHIQEAQIESRYLGLYMPDNMAEKINILRDYALKYIDIDALLDIAGKTEPLSYTQNLIPIMGSDPLLSLPNNCEIKIYAASDEAFSFWYEDNHDLLKTMGAEIKFFSPIHDQALPDDADGLLLWGGYPELYASALEANIGMKHSLKSAIEKRLPVYAEGGGFMYLHQSLNDLQGNTFRMLGVLNGNVTMTEKLQNFGYYRIEAQRDNMLCNKGGKINAHFFHRSVSGMSHDYQGDCFIALKQSGKSFPCIVSQENIFAGYQHLHFWGNSCFAQNFINNCIEYKKKRCTQ